MSVTSSPGRTTRADDRSRDAEVSTSPFAQYSFLGSRNTTGSGEAIAARIKSGTVNVDEGYALAFGSVAAPMGGMKASGVGRRHGADGILKYTESQTVSTARILNLDPPLGISGPLWQKMLTPMIRVVQALPGR